MANKNMTPGPDERDEYGTDKKSGTVGEGQGKDNKGLGRPEDLGRDRSTERDLDDENRFKQPERITPEKPSGSNQGNR